MTTSTLGDTDMLCALLSARRGSPVPRYGATALFEAISGGPVHIRVHHRETRPATAAEGRVLGLEQECVHERRGTLYTAAHVPVAETLAVLVPARLPEDIWGKLEGGTPLGRVLRGVSREPLGTRHIAGQRTDASGEEQVIHSRFRLWLGCVAEPVGLGCEWIYGRFVAAHPQPWDLGRDRAVRTYMGNPPAVGAPPASRWGYLPCGCTNDGYGRHAR